MNSTKAPYYTQALALNRKAAKHLAIDLGDGKIAARDLRFFAGTVNRVCRQLAKVCPNSEITMIRNDSLFDGIMTSYKALCVQVQIVTQRGDFSGGKKIAYCAELKHAFGKEVGVRSARITSDAERALPGKREHWYTCSGEIGSCSKNAGQIARRILATAFSAQAAAGIAAS